MPRQCLIPTGGLDEGDGAVEEIADALIGQKRRLGTIRNDLSLFQQNHPFDFRRNLMHRKEI